VRLVQRGRDVGNLRILRKQEAVELGGEPAGEAGRDIEQRAILEVQNAQIRDHPALRREVRRVADAARGQCGDVIGQQTLQPAQAIRPGDVQQATVAAPDQAGAVAQGVVALSRKHG
jgi:hypothetical protein